MPLLETLFDAKKVAAERIDLVVDSDLLEALKAEPIGDEPFELDLLEAKFQEGTTVTFFHQPFQIQDTGLDATAFIHEAGWSAPLFGENEALTTPAGKRIAELNLTGRFGIAVERNLPLAPLTFAASAGASGRLDYRYWLPVKDDSMRANALAGVVRNTRLPHNLELAKLLPGAALDVEGWINLRLGLQTRFGRDLDIEEVVRLFDGFAPDLQAHVRFSFEASLGWSLYEEMRMTVARAAVLNEGWVRVRLERTSERRLSLGAVMSLDVEYDLGTDQLEALLDRSLGLVSNHRVIQSFEELHGLLEEGGWEAVQKKISDEAADWLTEYLGDRTWRKFLDGSDEVKELTGLAAEVVETFDGIPGRVQSLWADVLTRVGLDDDSAVIQALTKIAESDPSRLNPEALLGSEWRQALPLVETLSGTSLEDLLVTGLGEAREALTQAKDYAQKTLDLVNDLPDEVTQRLDELFEKNGITRVVDFLREVDSVDELKEKVDEEARVRIERLTSRLVGKAFDEIGVGDLERIRRWADRVADLLDKKDEWSEKIRAAIGRLEGEVGFSVTLEMERLTRRIAVLDLEVDPSHGKAIRAVEEGLRSADAREILDELPEPEGDDDLPYQLRESVFSVRRTRTGMASTLLSVAGLSFFEQSIGRRVEETTVRVTQDGSELERTGTYRAGYLRTEKGIDSDSFTGGVWLSARGSAAGSKDLSAPYDELSTGLELVARRDDPKTLERELTALETWLGQLGFEPSPDGPALPDASTPLRTRFALRVRLPQDAVEGYLAELGGAKKTAERGWNRDFRNAAHRWYSDRLVSRTLRDRSDVLLGRALAAFVASDLFAEHGLHGSQDLRNWAVVQGSVQLSNSGRFFELPLVRTVGRQWAPDALSLPILAASRGLGLTRHRKLETVHREVLSDREPEDLEQWLRGAAKAFQAAWSTAWPNPCFGFWLVLARLHRLAPEVFAQATGVASLRWQLDAAAEWSGPATWVLPRGTGIPDVPLGGIFPVP